MPLDFIQPLSFRKGTQRFWNLGHEWQSQKKGLFMQGKKYELESEVLENLTFPEHLYTSPIESIE
jgi:hypothetical protein